MRSMGRPSANAGIPRRFRRAVLVFLVLAIVAPSPAGASRGLVIGIADDGVTQRDPALTASLVPRWKAAGVEVARVLVIWRYAAPNPYRMHAPAGFDASDPDDARYSWGPVDNAIAALRAQGIEPIISVTGPGPVWGSRAPARRSGQYKPDPRKFAAFAAAVAHRYGNAVRQYIVWNEPNLPAWLQPQFTCRRRHCTPASPALYRDIYRQASSAIKRADHGARVYAGALSSRGQRARSANAVMKPLTFLRALGCVDRHLRRDRRSPTCRKGFHPISTDGIAYHPHSGLVSPTTPSPDPDDAAIADTARLLRTIDAIQHRHGLRHSGSFRRPLSLYFDEYGYQTNPPDRLLGVSLAHQAAWIQEAAYLAWRQPRVRMLVQYLWRDDPVGPHTAGTTSSSGWQSGLTDARGRPKPALRAFANPFWASLPRGRHRATLWGQARPAPGTTVAVQRRTRHARSYTTIRRLVTDRRGFFSLHTTVRSRTSYRFRYRHRTGSRGDVTTVTSPSTTVEPRAIRQR